MEPEDNYLKVFMEIAIWEYLDDWMDRLDSLSAEADSYCVLGKVVSKNDRVYLCSVLNYMKSSSLSYLAKDSMAVRRKMYSVISKLKRM